MNWRKIEDRITITILIASIAYFLGHLVIFWLK